MSPMNNMYPKPMPVSAGKVYPADQPMVNIQRINYNLTVIYLHSFISRFLILKILTHRQYTPVEYVIKKFMIMIKRYFVKVGAIFGFIGNYYFSFVTPNSDISGIVF